MLALVRLQTEYLNPSSYGKLALCMTFYTFFNQTMFGSLSSGVARYYSISRENNDFSSFKNSCSFLVFICTVITTIIFALVFIYLIFSDKIFLIILVLLLFALSLFAGYNSIFNSIQNAARNRYIVALHTCLDAWIKVLLIYFLSCYFYVNVELILFAYCTSSLLINISHSLFLKKSLNFILFTKFNFINKAMVKKIVLFSWPFSFWGFFSWLHHSSSRWSLESFCSQSEVGQFAVLFQIGYIPIGLIMGFIVTLIYPILYESAGDATDFKRVRSVSIIIFRFTFISVSLTVLISLITYFYHEIIFELLVSLQYQSISYLLPLMVVAGGIFASSQILALKLMSEVKSHHLIFPKVGSFIIGITCSIIGCYINGIHGAIFALIIFSFSSLFFTIITIYRVPNHTVIT